MIAKRRYSIRGKLTGVIMLTSTTAVLLACLGFVASDFVSLRRQRMGDLSMLAQVTGSNSTAAVTFGDRQAAQEVLNALQAKPSIVAACIYDGQGKPFARYAPDASVSFLGVPLPDGFHYNGNRLELYYGIRLDNERVGTLYIASDGRERKARLKQYGAIAAGIVLVSLIIAFVLSSTLQRSISAPIVELSRVASVVSRDKNFGVRTSDPGLSVSHEIDTLMTGFNGMLAEIEQRDDMLFRYRMDLEEKVTLRTQELTSAKNAAERVAEINAQLARESALILNSATDGIMGVDLDNRLTFLNPAGARMLGVTVGELEGKSIHAAVHHSYPDGTPFPEKDCLNTQAMLRGESVAIADDVLWRQDGTSFPVEHSSTAMFDENGNQRGVVVMFRDVTERRAIERLKGEFISTVSHELRTPLTSIRGALGLLSSGMLGSDPRKGQRMLEIAVNNTDRLVRLINNILDLERIDSGRVELDRGPVDAGAVMMQALEGVQSIADEAGVRLVVVPATEALWGDSDRIIQTLTNLLGNAIKFSSPDTTVTLSGAARESEFAFCIADQGRGVPEHKLETIFERFSQVDASDSRDKGGTGLGLAICRSIVHGHGGRIWAEKNEPVGTRFQFTIPLTVPSVIPAPPVESAAHALDPVCPSVLVVEDDLDLARVMTTTLQSRGIRTVHTDRGTDVVQLCTQQEPSLIVLDLVLPGMDGFAVVRSLRESTSLSRIPVLVYSALDLGSADQSLLRLGPTEFLTKSRCSLADFENHVVRLLGIVTNTAKDQHAA